MRERLAQTTLVIFLMVSLVAVADVRTGSSDPPVIQVVPRISTGAYNETFTIDITIANVTMENSQYGVYGWLCRMSFDPDVLNVTSMMEGPWLKTGGSTFFQSGIDQEAGTLVVASMLFPYPDEGVVGSGTLANVTFLVLGIGVCPLDLYETELRTFDGIDLFEVDHTYVSGFFSNVHDVAVTSVIPSATQVNVGDPVDVDVIVANEGDFNETFDVTTYWNIGSSDWSGVINETKTGIYLESGMSTLPPLTFTWNTAGFNNGTYTVSANVSGVAGETNFINNKYVDGQVTVNVPGAPTAAFTYFPKIPYVDESVTFNSTSYDSDGWIAIWEWDLDGDGTVDATTENVTHIYTDAGTYTAVLFVTDDEGKKAFSSESIKVVVPPVADFTYSPTKVLVRQPVNFNSTSYDSDGWIAIWEWDLDGDGTVDATTENVTHIYTDAGTYTVNLTVTDNDGLSDSITEDVEAMIKHDVAMVKVKLRKTTAYAGESIGINMTVRNYGTETETFNVTAYYDNTTIQTLEVADLAPLDRAPNNTKQIRIIWLTKDVATGNYTVTAEANLGADEDLTNNINSTTIEITAIDVAVTNVEASPTVVLAGGLLNVTVVVENKGSGLANPLITIELANATGHTRELDTKSHVVIETAAEETVLFTYLNVTQKNFSPGIYNLSAKVILTGEPSAVQGDNYFTYGEITVGASLISISATREEISLGSSTTINGSITPLRRNVTVTIHYRVSGNDTWSILESVMTDNENGIYSYEWTPESAGTYEVKASWEGDNNTLPSESETLTLIVNPTTPILLYALAVVAAAAAIIVVAIYFLKIRKPKAT